MSATLESDCPKIGTEIVSAFDGEISCCNILCGFAGLVSATFESAIFGEGFLRCLGLTISVVMWAVIDGGSDLWGLGASESEIVVKAGL